MQQCKIILLIYTFLLGLIGQLERATHIDLNGDGRIGGHPGHYRLHQ